MFILTGAQNRCFHNTTVMVSWPNSTVTLAGKLVCKLNVRWNNDSVQSETEPISVVSTVCGDRHISANTTGCSEPLLLKSWTATGCVVTLKRSTDGGCFTQIQSIMGSAGSRKRSSPSPSHHLFSPPNLEKNAMQSRTNGLEQPTLQCWQYVCICVCSCKCIFWGVCVSVSAGYIVSWLSSPLCLPLIVSSCAPQGQAGPDGSWLGQHPLPDGPSRGRRSPWTLQMPAFLQGDQMTLK